MARWCKALSMRPVVLGMMGWLALGMGLLGPVPWARADDPLTLPPPADFAKFAKDCAAELEQAMQKLAEKWDVQSCQSWELSQSEMAITFTKLKTGQAKASARVQLIGTYNATLQAWEWGWANRSFEADLARDVAKLKDYGTRHKLSKLTQRGWPKADEAECRQLAAVAWKLLPAAGVFRAQVGGQTHFFLIRDLRDLR
jgi:hypothetical protein